MKLIKNNINFPRSTYSVKGAIRRAQAKALEQSWSKIIIIGEGSAKRGVIHSSMLDSTKFGLIEIAKIMLSEEL